MEVVKVKAIVKDCKITDECGKLNFSGSDFTPDQYKLIAKLVKTKAAVNLVLQPIQEELFDEGDDS
jgi:hypothetical protein